MSRTVPAVALQNPGNVVDAALWNSGPKAITDFYGSPPMFRGRQGSIQTAPNNTWWSVSLTLTDIDTEGGHSNTVNNTRYTCQVAGWYWVEGFTAWTSAGAQSRMDLAIALSGSFVLGIQQSLIKPGFDYSAISASGIVYMNVGDFVEVLGRQNTGGNLNTIVASDLCPCMNVFWIHS